MYEEPKMDIIGKTAFFLYPNIEFCCASGMSFINSDTKGDVARNYGEIAQKYYGYNVSVLDLRIAKMAIYSRKISIDLRFDSITKIKTEE